MRWRLWLADRLHRTVAELDGMPVTEFNMTLLWHVERVEQEA